MRSIFTQQSHSWARFSSGYKYFAEILQKPYRSVICEN